MVLYLDELIRPASDILDREDIPIIVWGEVTMKLHKIPTGILRVDILVPDDKFAGALSAFDAEGWKVCTGPFPRPRAGFDQSGWEVVAKACRRYCYPPSLVPEVYEIHLFVLPTSFAGLGPNPSLDSEEYTRNESFGPNVYIPSPYLMARTIALTYVRNFRHGSKDTIFSLLLRAWASYFYDYCGFHEASLDSAEQEVKEFWRSCKPME